MRDIEVAVKFLKEEASEIDKVKFLQEAAIMAQFAHPNVVSLYGVVSKTEPVSSYYYNNIIESDDNRILKLLMQLMLVVELVEKGDLRNHLYTMRPE